jgi:acyl-CoA synthetase (NDP forming)
MSDLQRVLRPRSLAIVGASPDGSKFGGKVMNFLRRHGYTGRVLPINPRYETIDGLPCYPTLSAIPADIAIDAVMVAVAREQANDIIRECCDRRVAVAVVFTSGFAEAGPLGEVMQAELLATARRGGVRVLGPNSFGFINFLDRVTATPSITLSHGDMIAGPIGMVSHSGGAAMGSIYARARDRGINFSYIVCPGNECDVDAGEIMDFLLDDTETKVIAAVLEGVSDGPHLVSVMQRAMREHKPIVVLKVGRSEVGKQIAMSHTAHMAGEDDIFDAVTQQYGAIRVDDYDELYLQAGMMASLSHAQKETIARRAGVAYISISGGIAAITGDLAGMAGLPLSSLSAETNRRLQALLPEFQSAANPFDVGAVALSNPSVVMQAIDILADDPGVGIIVPCITVAENYDSILNAIAASERRTPVVILWAGKSFKGEGVEILHKAGVPYFDAPRDLVNGLKRLSAHCLAAFPLPPPGADKITALPCPATAIIRPGVKGQTALSEHDSKTWLAGLGFPIVPGALVRDEISALQEAQRLGYPVVLKLVSEALAHKSEHGAVLLNLRDEGELRDAYRRLQTVSESLHIATDGMLVETMITDGVEVVVGFKRDPQFGPVVMLGIGGVLVELIGDVSFLVPPFNEEAALAAISRTSALDTVLCGFRGKPEADRAALVGVLARFGALALPLSKVASEIEMNPVLVRPKGKGAVIADALVKLCTETEYEKDEPETYISR